MFSSTVCRNFSGLHRPNLIHQCSPFHHHTLHIPIYQNRFVCLLYLFGGPNAIKYLLNIRWFYFILTDRKTFTSFTHKYITNEQILQLFNNIQIQRFRDGDCNILFIGFSLFCMRILSFSIESIATLILGNNLSCRSLDSCWCGRICLIIRCAKFEWNIFRKY